jgi:putative intracellular protease/amidase
LDGARRLADLAHLWDNPRVASVLALLPAQDFDPTEVAVPWKILTGAGHTVRFATPSGRPSRADDIMISGKGLDPWSRIPGLGDLVVFGRILRADGPARAAYAELVHDHEFNSPMSWEAIQLQDVGGLLLPGGHRARGMREYLESERLQTVVAEAFRLALPIAAICHGVLLAARSIDPGSGRSVLHGRRTTALTWRQERMASSIGRIVRFWDPTYYRTYPETSGQPAGYMSVQAEVTRLLARPDDFVDVGRSEPDARIKNDGRHRDRLDDARPAHVVVDGNYVSARWPGDAHTFAQRFKALLETSGPVSNLRRHAVRP